MSAAFGRMTLLVHDYDEALAFYRSAFGVVPIFDATAGGHRYVHVAFPRDVGDASAPDAEAVGLWFLVATDREHGRVGRQTGGEPVGIIYTTDCAASVARAASAGAEVRRPPVSDGGATFAHVADPYGNEWVLVELVTA